MKSVQGDFGHAQLKMVADVYSHIIDDDRCLNTQRIVPMATERIEGWWFQESVKALSSTNPTITTQRQLRSKIYDITRQYGDDNLPIEFWDLDEIEEAELDPKDRIFLEQLRLLQYKSRSLRIALQDYYKALMQRSSWLRQGLVFTNELDTYEHRLKDAWEHAFADMEEDLKDYENPTEQEKIKRFAD